MLVKSFGPFKNDPTSNKGIVVDVWQYWSLPSDLCFLSCFSSSAVTDQTCLRTVCTQLASYLFHCSTCSAYWPICTSVYLCFADTSCVFGKSDHIYQKNISLTQWEFKEWFLLWIARCMYSLNSHPLISHSLTLEVMNKSPSAESNSLLYCLHRGDYPEKTSIRSMNTGWIQAAR